MLFESECPGKMHIYTVCGLRGIALTIYKKDQKRLTDRRVKNITPLATLLREVK